LQVNIAMSPVPPLLSACHPCFRHVTAPHRTTFKLETEFWLAIDRLADKPGHSWSEWVATQLTGKLWASARRAG
jgi:hypothetical protein